MSDESRLRALDAAAMWTRLALAPLTDALLPLSPRDRLDLIEERRGAAAGLRYLAHALAEREAVWWASNCVRHVLAADSSPHEVDVIRAARDWVRKPDPAARPSILALVREAGATTAAGFVGRAAYAARLEDPRSLRAGLSVAGATEAALANIAEPARTETARRFRESALDIAAGGPGRIGDAR